VPSDRLLKHLVIPVIIAVVFYIIAFTAIERHRHARKPWSVEYAVSHGIPAIIVHQPDLGIDSFQITFGSNALVGATAPGTVVFDDLERTNAPFGRVEFLDTTFLPGTVVLDLFGHQVQLMPRVLTVNGREIPWTSKTNLSLANEPPFRSKKP
jgi:hypothetical protein